jgi:hypothetical protein
MAPAKSQRKLSSAQLRLLYRKLAQPERSTLEMELVKPPRRSLKLRRSTHLHQRQSRNARPARMRPAALATSQTMKAAVTLFQIRSYRAASIAMVTEKRFTTAMAVKLKALRTAKLAVTAITKASASRRNLGGTALWRQKT